jgi:hypothetical protein
MSGFRLRRVVVTRDAETPSSAFVQVTFWAASRGPRERRREQEHERPADGV